MFVVHDNLPPLKAHGGHNTDSCDVSAWMQAACSKNLLQLDDDLHQYNFHHLERQSNE
jgi:hypothetical protein